MTPDPEVTVDPEQSVEVPESELEEPDQSFALVGAIIRKPANQVIRPLPHVQAFADALLRETGATSFGTYLGHSPTAERAIDAFTPVNSSKLGDAMCAYALANWRRFGLRYMIYRQRIHWGPGDSWTPMADRGDDTQNHFDHAHFSFETETEVPKPIPDPDPQGDIHMLTFRYIFDGLDWVFDGPSRLFFHADDTDQITQVLDKIGVPALGKVSPAVHRRYSQIAEQAKFTG